MEDIIYDFIKISDLEKILLVTNSDTDTANISNDVLDNKNTTIINVTSDIINELKDSIAVIEYDLIIVDSDFSSDDFLKTLNNQYNKIPLLILNSSFKLSEDTSIYNLSSVSLSSEYTLIYSFNLLDKKLSMHNSTNPELNDVLNQVYLSYYNSNNSFSKKLSSKIYPLSLFIHSNKIGGISNLATNIKGYNELNNGDFLNIGYYLRTNDIKQCDNAVLHYMYTGSPKGFRPNEEFDNKSYLEANPDLQDLKINPSIHYVLYGKNENRTINSHIRGALQNNVIDNTLKGWIAEIGNNNPIKAEIKIDNDVYPVLAYLYRKDLDEKRINQGKHGFEFKIPTKYHDKNNHTITLIYAENTTISKITYNYIENTKRYIKGNLQKNINDNTLKGWIAEIGNNNPLEAKLQIDKDTYPITADLYREDLDNKINQGKHGFEFKIPTKYHDKNNHTITLLYQENIDISEITFNYVKNLTKLKKNKIKGDIQSSVVDNILRGWIVEIGDYSPVEADIKIDEETYPITADIYREDLDEKKINHGEHGFEFEMPEKYNDGNDHKIELYYYGIVKISEITYNSLKNEKQIKTSNIKGNIQSNIKDTLIKGWIAEIDNDNPIEACLRIDGEDYPVNANIYREDLKRNGINNGKHGFEFNMPEKFVDGQFHTIQLVVKDKVFSEVRHSFAKYDYENNIERFFAHSMTSPEMILPPPEPRKKILAVLNNIAEYLKNQVKNNPLVSVIMPVYNREELISNAIESVLNQSYKNLELIIINDASSDNTLQKIKEFDDDRIILINNENNMGVSKSRNIGLKESKGKYIMYLDSDNDWEEDYVKTTLGAYCEIEDADAVYSGQYVYEKNKDKAKYIRYGTINKGLLTNRNYVDLNCFSHTRSIYEREGGFDEDLKRFVDWDLLLKYMTFGKVYSVPIIMSNYYNNIAENSISNNVSLLSQSEEVIKKQQERLRSKEYDFSMEHGVSVIIPSYESLDDLKECVNSLFNLNASWLEIIIVDNNSSEEVIRYLINLKNENKIKLILNNENVGFTLAVNQAIEISDIRNDILLLNNDAVVTENAIELLQKAAYELEECGITVPQQILPANTKTINTHVPFAHNDIECDVNLSNHHKNIINVPLFHNGEYTELSFAPFFCVYIKRDTYNKSLGLDAELGRHFRSDMIYCNFIRTILHQKIYHVSEAKVYHKLQKSTTTLKEKSSEKHDLLYVKNRWSEKEQEKYGFKTAKWDFD